MSERRNDLLSRRDWLTVMGAAGAGALIAPGLRAAPSPSPAGAEPILPLTSTSEVFIPGRGRGFQKFSFDFPEPSVEFAGLRFGFLVFSRENAYALDARQTGVPRLQHFEWVGKFYEREEDACRVAAVLRELAASDCRACAATR